MINVYLTQFGVSACKNYVLCSVETVMGKCHCWIILTVWQCLWLLTILSSRNPMCNCSSLLPDPNFSDLALVLQNKDKTKLHLCTNCSMKTSALLPLSGTESDDYIVVSMTVANYFPRNNFLWFLISSEANKETGLPTATIPPTTTIWNQTWSWLRARERRNRGMIQALIYWARKGRWHRHIHTHTVCNEWRTA